MYFPKVNPKNVNEKLHIINIVLDNIKLFVIAFKPNPILKLSNDTPKAKRNIPVFVRDISFSDGFIYSINICNDIRSSIKPNNISVFMLTILFIIFDKNTPNNGIKK